MLEINVPGKPIFYLERLLIDVNGTICRDGILLPGVKERLQQINQQLEVIILTADTFGTAGAVAGELGLTLHTVSSVRGQEDKLDYLLAGNSDNTVAIGNGFNDVLMLQRSALSICILGAEGCALAAVLAADVLVKDINDALDLLIKPSRLIATLRQ